MKKFTAIDLFCGAGGVSQALKEYFDVKCAVEFDRIIANTYMLNHNHNLLTRDITTIQKDEWIAETGLQPGELDLLVGTPPCQGYSKHTRKKSTENKDKRNELIFEVIRVSDIFHPKFIFFENVTNIINFQSFRVFLKRLSNIKRNGEKRQKDRPSYHIRFEKVDASNYNVPQKRNRLILVAKRIDEDCVVPDAYIFEEKKKKKRIPFVTKPLPIWPKEEVSLPLGQYLENFKLPSLEAGQTDPYDPLHTCRNLSADNRRRIEATPLNGGSRRDWPDELGLQLPCHQKKRVSFGDVYGRMDSNSYAPTITCGCLSYSKGRFGHWEQNRAISLREAALIQTFPPNYIFTGSQNGIENSGSKEHMATQIGNAVPVQLALAFVKEIYSQLNNDVFDLIT